MVERIVVGAMSTNAYLYSEWKKECIVIDPGADEEELVQHMTIKNLHPRGIIFTHGHIDHISAAVEIRRYFERQDIRVPVAVHEADASYLGRAAARIHRKSLAKVPADASDYYEHALLELAKPDILMKEGDHPFESDLEVIHTPGHTPGSICLYSENQELLFSGDTLFFEGIGDAALNDKERRSLIESVRTKLFTLPRATRVFPGHGPFTTLEREIQHNPHIN